MANENNQLNLTVVALVALVAIVGLVALVMNAASITKLPTGSQLTKAEPSQNTVGDLRRTKPIEYRIPEKKQQNPGLQIEENSAGSAIFTVVKPIY